MSLFLTVFSYAKKQISQNTQPKIYVAKCYVGKINACKRHSNHYICNVTALLKGIFTLLAFFSFNRKIWSIHYKQFFLEYVIPGWANVLKMFLIFAQINVLI